MVTGIALTMKGEVSDQNDQCVKKVLPWRR